VASGLNGLSNAGKSLQIAAPAIKTAFDTLKTPEATAAMKQWGANQGYASGIHDAQLEYMTQQANARNRLDSAKSTLSGLMYQPVASPYRANNQAVMSAKSGIFAETGDAYANSFRDLQGDLASRNVAMDPNAGTSGLANYLQSQMGLETAKQRASGYAGVDLNNLRMDQQFQADEAQRRQAFDERKTMALAAQDEAAFGALSGQATSILNAQRTLPADLQQLRMGEQTLRQNAMMQPLEVQAKTLANQVLTGQLSAQQLQQTIEQQNWNDRDKNAVLGFLAKAAPGILTAAGYALAPVTAGASIPIGMALGGMAGAADAYGSWQKAQPASVNLNSLRLNQSPIN
jgi:hypothetical protein